MRSGRRFELVSPVLPRADDLLPEIEEALATKRLSNNGPFVQRLERAMEEVLGVPDAVATSSCTLGLIVAMRALGWRGEVISPSFSFPASAHAITWAGCTPVLAEVDPDTWLLDSESVARLVGPATAGILAVDLFGLPVDLAALRAAAGSVPILVDAAHSFGSTRAEAAPPDAAVYSLHATKTIAAGEGGLVCVTQAEPAARVRRLINFGFEHESYDCGEVGTNAKLPELSAILAYHQIDGAPSVTEGRRRWDAAYRAALGDVRGIRFQALPENRRSNHEFSVIGIDAERFGRSRDEVLAALLEQGIVAKPYFSPPIHAMRCYVGKLRCDDLRITEALSNAALCLPVHPDEPASAATAVADQIRSLARPPASAAASGRS